MTNLADLDRALADFLEDGPNTAPEAPIIAAMAHARTTPRRPDVVRAFRSDVMAARRSFNSRGVAVFGLAAVLVAGLGAALIGSRPTNPAVNPPPSDTVLPTPSSSTSVAPLFSAEIQLQLSGGRPLTLVVADTTGALVDAETGTPGDGASQEIGTLQIAADPADPAVLIATWTGDPCETRASMLVDERTSTISVITAACSGGESPRDRVVRLSFRDPVDATTWAGSVAPAPTATPNQSFGPPVPSEAVGPVAFSFDVDDGVGGPTYLDVVDLSGHLTNARSGSRTDPLPDAIMQATNVDARTIRLSWRGSPCDAIARLTIAADLGLRIERPDCTGDAIATDRSVLLSFDRDVNADTLDTALGDVGTGSEFPWAVEGVDSAGVGYNLRVADANRSLATVASMIGGTPAPEDRTRLDQAGGDIIELVWTARACDTTPTLLLDTSGTHWLLSDAACGGDAPTGIRRVSLKFSGPRPVAGIVVTLIPTNPT